MKIINKALCALGRSTSERTVNKSVTVLVMHHRHSRSVPYDRHALCHDAKKSPLEIVIHQNNYGQKTITYVRVAGACFPGVVSNHSQSGRAAGTHCFGTGELCERFDWVKYDANVNFYTARSLSTGKCPVPDSDKRKFRFFFPTYLLHKCRTYAGERFIYGGRARRHGRYRLL